MLVAGIRLSLSMLPRGELGKGTKAGIRGETGALRPVAVLDCECRHCHTHPDLAKTRTRRANHPQSWSSPSTDCSSPRTPDLCCDFQHRRRLTYVSNSSISCCPKSSWPLGRTCSDETRSECRRP